MKHEHWTCDVCGRDVERPGDGTHAALEVRLVVWRKADAAPIYVTHELCEACHERVTLVLANGRGPTVRERIESLEGLVRGTASQLALLERRAADVEYVQAVVDGVESRLKGNIP